MMFESPEEKARLLAPLGPPLPPETNEEKMAYLEHLIALDAPPHPTDESEPNYIELLEKARTGRVSEWRPPYTYVHDVSPRSFVDTDSMSDDEFFLYKNVDLPSGRRDMLFYDNPTHWPYTNPKTGIQPFSARSSIDTKPYDNSPALLLVCPGGIISKARQPLSPSSPPHDIPRGQITEFSRKSRTRFGRKMATIEWPAYVSESSRSLLAPAVFMTLTYPKEFPKFWQKHKAHLRAFRERLTRFTARLGVQFAAIWKLEYQERKAPHYHLILFFSQGGRPSSVPVRLLRSWASRAWSEVVKNDSSGNHHRRFGVDVSPVYSKSGNPSVVMNYILKYVAKDTNIPIDEDGQPLGTGRIWGIWFKDFLPTVPPVIVRFTSYMAYVVFVARVRHVGEQINSRYLANAPPHSTFFIFGGILDWRESLKGLEEFYTIS